MSDFLNYKLLSISDTISITVWSVIGFLLVLLFSRLAIFFVSKALRKYSKRKHIDRGRQHLILQLMKYLIYFIAFIAILNVLKIDSSKLLLGSGALLVGVGIGLQQTFNDVFSGIILLFEGSVKVGDKLVVDELICQVKHIGLRTTQVTTLDNISIIIPNSILVTNKVTNWSHNRKPARFHIDVGVSYSSDIDFVEKILLSSLDGQAGVLRVPKPAVQLVDYGSSSVDFRLYFFSTEFFSIQEIKSNIRKEVFRNFGKHNIEIPFPQRDLWVKTLPSK